MPKSGRKGDQVLRYHTYMILDGNDLKDEVVFLFGAFFDV